MEVGSLSGVGEGERPSGFLIEKETKLVVSPEDYRVILREGTVLDCRDQLNIYLHDPERLREGLGSFRIRFESGRQPMATLKIPIRWVGEMREMVEIERPLSQMGPAFFPRPRRWIPIGPGVPEDYAKHFQDLGLLRIRRLGWMRNHRCVLDLGEIGQVELDRTRLPDGRFHYEAEIEEPSEDKHAALVAAVKDIAPSAKGTRIGKFTRFIASLGLS